MSKLEATIPFQGFYESIHGINIDEAIESFFQDDEGNYHIPDNFWEKVDYKKIHLAYSKLYTESFFEHLKNEFDLELNSYEFSAAESPRFYNYETDRIFVSISLEDAEKILNIVDKNELNDLIKERFTSHDGFISHYPNSLSEWPESVSEWDLNQIGTLFDLFNTENEFVIMESKSDEISNIIDENLPEVCRDMITHFNERVKI